MTPDLPRAGTVTLFTTHWCPYCLRLKATLRREGVPFNEVDIGSSEDGAVFVMSVNGGNETVPTVLFPDGSTLTNPSAGQVRSRLAATHDAL